MFICLSSRCFLCIWFLSKTKYTDTLSQNTLFLFYISAWEKFAVFLQPVTPKLNGCFVHFSCQYLFPASVFGVNMPLTVEAALGSCCGGGTTLCIVESDTLSEKHFKFRCSIFWGGKKGFKSALILFSSFWCAVKRM